MDPLERVIQLAKEAEAKLDITFNAPDVLPFVSAAMKIIKSNPSLQSEFEQTFIEMPAYGAREFIEVCMHSLRWQKVKDAYEKLHREAVDRNDWRAEPVYRHLLEAFEPDWEDAKDFYVSYFETKNVS